MSAINAAFGWVWLTLGMASGIYLGLNFQRSEWLGGYASWARRLLRLGHVAMIALGALNVLFALTVPLVHFRPGELPLASASFIVGAVTMPLVCGLAAWRPPLRHLFVIPVASLLTASITLSVALLRGGGAAP